MFERTATAPTGEASRKRRFDVDRDWSPVPGEGWLPGFAVGREQIYDESGRLARGPQDGPENGR